MKELNSLFNADSVAVVGASNKAGKKGYEILDNLITGGFEGKIYPVNPKDDKVQGLKAYKTLTDIGSKIDLIVIVVPNKFVPSILEEAGKLSILNAVIITGGFREIGCDDLESAILEVAQKYNINIVGPNCQGVNYTPNKMCVSWPLIEGQGSMAIVAQSGTVAAQFGIMASKDQLGISGLVSLGNKSGLTENDFLNFFGSDLNTKVIALNLEGVKDGPGFLKLAGTIRKHKPVIILKPGRTAKGMVAAQSHTKSIAGSDKIFTAACRQFGLIRAESIDELYDYAKILAYSKKASGNRVQIITSSGGSGIIATDILDEVGVDLVEIDHELKAELKSELPPHCVISNPLDLTGDTDAERYAICVENAIKYDYTDIFLLIFGDPIIGASEVVSRLKEKTDKPIIVCYLGGGEVEDEETRKMHQIGIPTFPTPTRAAKAIGILSKKI
jgi:acyl-CoA synthetase (NDP forming)